MLALRELGPSRFHGIGGCWVGCLLQEGMVYRHLSSKKVYLSLGFQHQALFGWELEELEDRSLCKLRVLFVLILEPLKLETRSILV